MLYLEGYVYHIKDEYFKKVNDDKLMQNKENGQYRPTYFCLKDTSTSLLWVVPMSTKYEKYKQIAEKQKAKYGKSLGIVLGEYDGRKSVFLIQNMFPITENYLDHIHTRNGNPVPVKKSLQEIIKSRVKQTKILLSKGKKVVFSDVERLEKIMIEENKKAYQYYENIQAKIGENIKSTVHNGDRFSPQISLELTLKEYSFEDVQIATALAVNQNDIRFTQEVRNWALSFLTEEGIQLKNCDSSKMHPNVLNRFANVVIHKANEIKQQAEQDIYIEETYSKSR